MATASYDAFSSTFKVALIQMNPKPLDPEANYRTAEDYIRDASTKGASLAVLPEYHLSGWRPEDPQFAVIAETAYNYVSKYQALAKELKINIVAGTIVTTDPNSPLQTNGTTTTTTSKRPVLLNIAPFISYTGELLGTYTKTNLWHPERPHLTSGVKSQSQSKADPDSSSSHPDNDASRPKPDPHSVIETPLGPLGILVCWDLAFPEAFRSLIRAGARIIVIPTFWMLTDLSAEGLKINPLAEKLFLQSTLVTRAFENTCAVIFVNAGGPEADGFAGLSQVALPIIGTVEGSFAGSEAGMRVVEVDMSVCDVAERNYKVREDLKREDWHYGYEHAV